MTFQVQIKRHNGTVEAAVVGAPELRGVGPDRESSLSALRALLQQRMDGGELTVLDVEPAGLHALAGKYKDDPTWREMMEEAYRLRDEEKAREFPE
jgi:hypothetical protein